MNQRTLRIPGTLKHKGEQSDASLQETAREHVERHPGLLFLADVLRALHAAPAPLRDPAAFFDAFSPREVMDAFGERPDLRVRALKAITGGPTALLRRLSTEAVASQIDLLAIDELPEAERSVRADADRALSVHDLFLKYVDPVDIATYLPAGDRLGVRGAGRLVERRSDGRRPLAHGERAAERPTPRDPHRFGDPRRAGRRHVRALHAADRPDRLARGSAPRRGRGQAVHGLRPVRGRGGWARPHRRLMAASV